MSFISSTDPREYDFAIDRLRIFFRSKGFIEAPVQQQVSILAACEDPRTIMDFTFGGESWAMPQTGQMLLEYYLLTNPDVRGYYCISTSYRNEPDPIPGRHDRVFQMFEFETHGDMQTLLRLETALLIHLGFGSKNMFRFMDYMDTAHALGVQEITAEHEEKIWKEWHHDIFFLSHFPQYTSPFWNMKKVGDVANKIDVILYGMETIGSAERSTDVNEMRDLFHTISNGMYAQMLYAKFGKSRVEKRLENFLALPMITRCGGGIGITPRMIRALKLAGIMPAFTPYHQEAAIEL